MIDFEKVLENMQLEMTRKLKAIFDSIINIFSIISTHKHIIKKGR